jgi:hypothetical protein
MVPFLFLQILAESTKDFFPSFSPFLIKKHNLSKTTDMPSSFSDSKLQISMGVRLAELVYDNDYS